MQLDRCDRVVDATRDPEQASSALLVDLTWAQGHIFQAARIAEMPIVSLFAEDDRYLGNFAFHADRLRSMPTTL